MELAPLHAVLRAIAEGLLIPVLVILLLFMAITLVMLGSLIVELASENRRLNQELPKLATSLQKGGDIKQIIADSGILNRQKRGLTSIIDQTLSSAKRESLAIRIIEGERAYFDRITWITDVIARLGPAFGLIATLIPLGPGVVALGSGDTQTLSSAMLTAFDATVAGLISSGVAFIISGVRKRMYASTLSSLELATEYLVEAVENESQQ
jgi:biopolymer transport protein ExbB/TolQ